MTLTTAAIGPRERQILVDTASATETPFKFMLGNETLICTSGGGTLVWDIDRHANGSRATSHASGATVSEVVALQVPATPVPSTSVGSAWVEFAFTEAGAGTYTGAIVVPAGATVLDVIVRNTVVWAAGTSASLTVGDDDDADGYIAATNVKTTPAADTNGAAAGLSTRLSLGATAGAYKGGAGKFCAAAKTITATIVSVGAGTAGRTRVLVEIAAPATSAAAKA